MDSVQQLKDDVGELRRLVEAGHRGRPVGGEIVAAFGAIAGLTWLLQMALAFLVWPPILTPSPLAAACAFMAFTLLVTTNATSGRRSAIFLLAMSLLAGLAGQGIWQGALVWLRTAEAPDRGSLPVLLAFVALAPLVFGVATIGWLRRMARRADASSPVTRATLDVWLTVIAAMFISIGICVLGGISTGIWFGFMLLPSFLWLLWGIGWLVSGRLAQCRWMLFVAVGSWAVALWSTVDFYLPSIVGLFLLAFLPGLQLIREARAGDEA